MPTHHTPGSAAWTTIWWVVIGSFHLRNIESDGGLKRAGHVNRKGRFDPPQVRCLRRSPAKRLAMRRILLERARQKNSLKGGGNLNRVDMLDHDAEVNGPGLDMLALDEALQMLERSDSRAAQVIKLRFFGGRTIAQTAETLGISVATADNDWAFARSWLRLRMATPDYVIVENALIEKLSRFS